MASFLRASLRQDRAVLEDQVRYRNLQLFRGHFEQAGFYLQRGQPYGGRIRKHGLAAAADAGVLRGSGVGIFDLDPVQRHAQLLGHHHGHHSLGPGAQVGRADVEVDAAVGDTA